MYRMANECDKTLKNIVVKLKMGINLIRWCNKLICNYAIEYAPVQPSVLYNPRNGNVMTCHEVYHRLYMRYLIK